MEENNLVIIFTITLFIVVLTMIFIYAVFIKKKTTLLIAQKEKDLHFEKELATSQVEMKEQTLNYIGQELHDDLRSKTVRSSFAPKPIDYQAQKYRKRRSD